MEKDSASDHIKNRPSDHVEDSQVDQVKDSQVDQVKDSQVDHVKDSQVDHVKHSQVDQVKDSQVDHVKDSQVDQVKDSQVDQVKDSQVDQVKDSQSDHVKDSQSDHVEDSQVDQVKDSQVDQVKDSQSDHVEDSQVDQVKDSQVDHVKDSQVDHVKDSQLDHVEDCLLDKMDYSLSDENGDSFLDEMDYSLSDENGDSFLDEMDYSLSDENGDSFLDEMDYSLSDENGDSFLDEMDYSLSDENGDSFFDEMDYSLSDENGDSFLDEMDYSLSDENGDSFLDEMDYSLSDENGDSFLDEMDYSLSDENGDSFLGEMDYSLSDENEDSFLDMNDIFILESMFPLPENYKVESFLGEGSFGQVIKCFKKDTKETVAVKVFRDDEETTIDNELMVLTGINSKTVYNCNIVKLIDSFTLKDHRAALALEMLDMTLFHYIVNQKSSPLELHEVRAVVQQMATALNALKSNGWIHSDIKSDNIMVVDHEAKPIRVKLIDFGLAFSTHAAEQGTTLQTDYYRAPEIHLGLPFSEAIDMWALGIIMGFMLTAHILCPAQNAYEAMCFIIDLIGVPPDHLLKAGMYSFDFFIKTPSGGWRFKTPKEFWGWCKPWIDYRTYKFRSLDELETVSLPNLDKVGDDEKKECLDLLRAMLKIDPEERITPIEVLNHPFITRGSVQHSSDNEQPGTNETTEPTTTTTTTNDTKEPGTTQADEPKESKADVYSSGFSGFHGSTATPSPVHRVIMVKPAPPDCCRPLDEDDELLSESCSSGSSGFHGSTATPPPLCMVKPAPPDCCWLLDVDDELLSESCSVQKLEEPSENSPVEDLNEDESDRLPSLFLPEDCNSQLTEKKKRKKKNCFKRFFSWMKKTFCNRVSVSDG